MFSPLLVACLLLSVVLATVITIDGESDWLEGAALIALYAIIADGVLVGVASPSPPRLSSASVCWQARQRTLPSLRSGVICVALASRPLRFLAPSPTEEGVSGATGLT